MKVIYLTGPDGSGKTSFLEIIESYLKKSGRKTHSVWIRSPKIFSKPLMLYSRFAGLTKYETIDGIRYGAHEFYKSRFVSAVYPVLQFIDFKIKKWLVFKRIPKGIDTLLFDRYAIDTLADIMVDTGHYNLHKKYIGKAFLKTLPDNIKIIVLNVEENVIRKRKKDTLHDPHLKQKIEVYKILARDLNLKTIDNNKSFKAVKEQLFIEIGLDARN